MGMSDRNNTFLNNSSQTIMSIKMNFCQKISLFAKVSAIITVALRMANDGIGRECGSSD